MTGQSYLNAKSNGHAHKKQQAKFLRYQVRLLSQCQPPPLFLYSHIVCTVKACATRFIFWLKHCATLQQLVTAATRIVEIYNTHCYAPCVGDHDAILDALNELYRHSICGTMYIYFRSINTCSLESQKRTYHM